MPEPMIEITNLHKSFGAFPVLRGVNLTVEKGESMTVIGGSGSGKSVLIKHIIGLLFPDKGQVKVDGEVLNDLDEQGLNEVRKKFGAQSFPVAAPAPAFGQISSVPESRTTCTIAISTPASSDTAPRIISSIPTCGVITNQNRLSDASR